MLKYVNCAFFVRPLQSSSLPIGALHALDTAGTLHPSMVGLLHAVPLEAPEEEILSCVTLGLVDPLRHAFEMRRKWIWVGRRRLFVVLELLKSVAVPAGAQNNQGETS